jgi:hypothetical protein
MHNGTEIQDLTKESVRNRTQATIQWALLEQENALIIGEPSSGKSRGTIKAVATTGKPISVLTGRGLKEQYGQFQGWCEEDDLVYKILPSFTRDCETAKGEHGSEWKDRVMELYDRGAKAREIHDYFQGKNSILPCQHDGECSYLKKWDFDPYEYDVLIGHYSHAHLPFILQNRTLVIDEFPDAYETKFENPAPIVTPFLESHEDLPFSEFTELLEKRNNESRRTAALDWLERNNLKTASEKIFENDDAHRSAPAIVYTVLAHEKLGNGWGRVSLPGTTSADSGIELPNGHVGVFNRDDHVIHLLQPPNLLPARNVIGLDGTPTPIMWELTLNTYLEPRRVLSADERRTYLRDAMRYRFIQTTESIKPYHGHSVNVAQDTALLEAIQRRHDEKPALITSSRAINEYEESKKEPLRYVSDYSIYGNVLGSGKFENQHLGAVIGSRHYGDGFIKKWGAYAANAIDRNDGKGVELSYGEFGDKVLQHMREHSTLQAVLRFGRDGKGTTVYIDTNTLPDWVPIENEMQVYSIPDGMKGVVDAISDMTEGRTTEITNHPSVGVGRRQVRKLLTKLHNTGYVKCRREGRGFLWSDAGVDRLPDHGSLVPVN